MNVATQNFSKKIIIAFPAADAAERTLMAFRKHFPGGFEFQTPKGPKTPRLKPLRDAETNRQLTV
eukprot:2536602-Pyramimonas_sp.AAC.2